MITLRLIAGYAPAADWVLGMSKVRWREFFIGTVLGLGPITLLLAIFGDDTVRWVQTAPLVVLAVALFIGCLIVVVKKFHNTGN